MEEIVATSYNKVLTAICQDLLQQGKRAKVNTEHKCVDVFDEYDNPIEQHYPEFDKTTKSKRGKYVYVGEGNGTHIYTSVEYDRKHYKSDNHLVKYVEKVGRT